MQKNRSVIWKTAYWKSPNWNREKEKRTFKNEDSLRDLYDNIKHTNIHIIKIP